MGWPILVERLEDWQALRYGCESCGFEREGTLDDCYTDWVIDCEKGCGGSMDFKYVEADHKCFCGKLGFFPDALDNNCSRICQLQAEMAKEMGLEPAPSAPFYE